MNLVLDQSEVYEPQSEPVWQPLKTRLEPTDKLRLLLATPDRFRAWLHTNQPSDYVGTASDQETCPLHHWLADERIRNPFVGVSTIRFKSYWYSMRREYIVMSLWAYKFVHIVDHQLQSDISAKEALCILREIM